eukprot:gene8147-9679_t
MEPFGPLSLSPGIMGGCEASLSFSWQHGTSKPCRWKQAILPLMITLLIVAGAGITLAWLLPTRLYTLPLWVQTALVAAVPAAAMLVGSVLVLAMPRVNDNAQAALQNFSAGMLVAAVGDELFPLILKSGNDGESYISMFLGCLCGLLVMFGMKSLWNIDHQYQIRDHEEDEEQRVLLQEDPAEDAVNKNATSLQQSGLLTRLSANPLYDTHLDGFIKQIVVSVKTLQDEIRGRCDRHLVDGAVHNLALVIHTVRRMLRGDSQFAAYNVDRLSAYADDMTRCISLARGDVLQSLTKPELDERLRALQEIVDKAHEVCEHKQYRRWKVPHSHQLASPADDDRASRKMTKPLPIVLIVAVGIDAFVDGFLIGLSYIESHHAGYVLSAATCLEMGALGLTSCATVLSSVNSKKMMIVSSILVCLPVLTLVGSGALAGVLAVPLNAVPAVKPGFISFCVVALLFLVSQELLIEARENSANRWWINMLFFVGVFTLLAVDKATT